MLAERYRWTMADIDHMDISDYCQFVDGCREMYDLERKRAEAAAKARR